MEKFVLKINDTVRYVGSERYCQVSMFRIALQSSLNNDFRVIDINTDSMLIRIESLNEIVTYDICKLTIDDECSEARFEEDEL